jgi:ABC-type nitrate/sulfonate/bicarbonate transport system permease component
MSIDRAMQIIRPTAMAMGLPALLFVAWWISSSGSESIFFPPLSEILRTFADVWFSPRITHDVVPSLVRLFIGYLSAVALGLALGIAIGASRRMRQVLEPVLEFLRAIPPPVLVPIFMLFVGIGDTMKMLVIVSGCVWPVLLNTVAGVRALDNVLEEVICCYRIGMVDRLWHFVLPGASPQIFAGMRQALSIGIILMVISEMFAASNGLGFALVQFQRGFAIPEMWTGIILLGLIGILLAFIFRLFENWMLAWYFGFRRAQRESS